MAKNNNNFVEVTGSTTYTADDVKRIGAAMERLTKNTTTDEKRQFLQKAGILDKHGKLSKEYGG